jgi:alpha-galactosidase
MYVFKPVGLDPGYASPCTIRYDHVGVDDGWQACGTGVKKSFHAADGTPLVNASTFPDLKSLVDYGHGKQIKMGWYDDNCST